MKRICVFCGSSPGARPEYMNIAAELGALLAKENIGLVYGGASVGLMGAVADATLAAGGEVIGVIPKHLFRKEIAHQGLADLRIVNSMHERKALMEELSSGFIALPGGFGTFEEFFEIITWAQLGLHQKPAALLNVLGYYDSLLALLNRGIQDQFIREEHRQLVLSSESPSEILTLMKNYRPSALPKWIQDETET